MASKDAKFTITAKADGWDKLGEIMDQNEQRDYAEEAANRALIREEELEVTPDQLEAEFVSGFPYRVVLEEIGPSTSSIRLCDDAAEHEFYIEPETWPALKDMLEAEYQKWLNK